MLPKTNTISYQLFNSNEEYTYTYQRADGTKIDLCVLRKSLSEPARLVLALYDPSDPSGEPRQEVHFPLEEMRLLRDLLTSQDVSGLLGDS